jgi:hypothetical protein
MPGRSSTDPMLAPARPVMETIAEVGGTPALTLLTAVSRLDRGGLAGAAAQLARGIDAPLPDWLQEMGTATIVRAFSARSPGDGEALLLEASPVQDTPHMVAVFLDERRSGVVKHLHLTRVIDLDDPGSYSGAGEQSLGFRAVDPALACRRVRESIALTDAARGSVAGEGVIEHRALALARIDPIGGLAVRAC